MLVAIVSHETFTYLSAKHFPRQTKATTSGNNNFIYLFIFLKSATKLLPVVINNYHLFS